MELYADGCRSLFAEIINFALREALAFVRPRHPIERAPITVRNVKLLLLIDEALKQYGHLSTYIDSRYSANLILKTMRYLTIMAEHSFSKSESIESLCWNARKWLLSKDEFLAYYLGRIQIDVEAFQDKVSRLFKNIDS